MLAFAIQEVETAQATLDGRLSAFYHYLESYPKVDSKTLNYMYDVDFSFRELQIMIGRLISEKEKE
jgi:hypothetical protein